jgi:hypothetical protein
VGNSHSKSTRSVNGASTTQRISNFWPTLTDAVWNSNLMVGNAGVSAAGTRKEGTQ